MFSVNYNRTPNVFVDVNVGAKNNDFNIPLILDKYNIMIKMQKLKFMQEFLSAINVECLHSSLQAMTVHVQNMQKQVLYHIKDFESSV